MSHLFLPLLLAIAVTLFAWRRGYFRFPARASFYPITFLQVAGAFVIYIGITILYVPFLPHLAKIVSPLWLNLLYLFMICLCELLYLRLLNRGVGRALFNSDGMSKPWRSMAMGVMTWFVSYPYVLLVNHITKELMQSKGGDQLAVQLLRRAKENPILLTVLLFAVVIVVPFIEELLFRGFLQTFLRRFLNRFWAIALSSVIFACVHFSPGQNNVEIIISLLILAGFLGFIYERERKLWAPIALHATFNAVSSIIVLLSAHYS